MSTVPCSSCVALCPCRLGFLRFPGGVLWAVILILLFVLSPGIACARFLALYFHVLSLPLGWILHVAAAAGEAEHGAAGGSPRAAADAHPAGHSLGTLGVAAGWGAAPANCAALGNGQKQQIASASGRLLYF